MKIVMTGCNGFLGRLLVRQLEMDNHTVMPFDTRIHSITSIPERPDAFVHCARHHKNIVGLLTKEKWLKEYETDVIDPYMLSIELTTHYKIQNIVFFSSIYGLTPPRVRPIPANYCCAKAAEQHAARMLASILAPTTRVNCIVLGGVESDRQAAEQHEQFLEEYSKQTYLRHMVRQDEVYGVLKFLLSDESKGMTGSQIVIDGGYVV